MVSIPEVIAFSFPFVYVGSRLNLMRGTEMERVTDSNVVLETVGVAEAVAHAMKDVNKVEADRERARALRRQQRNIVLATPYHDVCSRMKGLQFQKSEIRFGDAADIPTIGTLLLDSMSELMIKSPSMLVPHDDIVGSLIRDVSQMFSYGDDQARYLIEKFIDHLSNRENGSKPFETRHWCLEKKTYIHERLRYLVYEEVGQEKGWRLSEDGMRLTLRVLNTDPDIGNLNHDLLERAFARKNIDEIMYNLNQYRHASRRQAALIQAAVRDIRMLTYLNWEHVGDPMLEGRSMVKKQSGSTQTFTDNINKLMGDESLQPSQRLQLAQALETLAEIDDATRKLNVTILSCEEEVRDVLSSSIKIMGGQTMLPDFFGEVLTPMLLLRGESADSYYGLVEKIFTWPEATKKLYDLEHLLNAAYDLQDVISEGEDEEEENLDFDDVEEEFVSLETMDLRARKDVQDIFQQAIALKPLFSDFVRTILASEDIREFLKKPIIFQALAPPAGYRSYPTGERYHIDDFMSGDDLIIEKEQ